MVNRPLIRNPHLDGDAFLWEAGSTGVVLVHGFTATTTEVRLLAQSLHASGYTVAAPLLPGHGTSPEDCNRHTWQDWYASAEGAFQDVASRCRKVAVGGESTGALLALHMAHNHPESAAILCYAPALRLQMNRVKISLLKLFSPFITSIPKPPLTDGNPWKGYSVNPLKAGFELYKLQKNTPPLLPHIRQPILVIQGLLDPTVHLSAPQLLYDQVGSQVKELHWLEHSTHCVILDREHQLAADLTLAFLQRVLAD